MRCRARPLIGKRVLVSGCGPIGVLAVAAARVHGAAEIVATDVVEAPLAVASALGADRTINAVVDAGWVERYGADKGTFDVMIECSGNARALRDGLDVMRPRGVVVQLGSAAMSACRRTSWSRRSCRSAGRSVFMRNSRSRCS